MVRPYDLFSLRRKARQRVQPPLRDTSDVQLLLRGLDPAFSFFIVPQSVKSVTCNLTNWYLHSILPLTKALYLALFYQQEASTLCLQNQDLILCLTKWRIHCGVEVTESSTNKQHTLSLPRYRSPSIQFPLFSTVRSYLTYPTAVSIWL